MESNTLAQYLGDSQKWRKAATIAREYFKFKILGSTQSLFTLVSSNPISNQPLNKKVWDETVKVPMSRFLFEQGGAKNTQDKYIDNGSAGDDQGFVQCRYEYELLETQNAISYTNETTHRSIFDGNGARLDTHSSIRSPFPDINNLHVKDIKEMSGLTANLYGTVGMSNGNFGHWIFDGLSRAFLIKNHYSLDDFDQFLVPPRKYDFHHESLEALGISDDRVVELQSLEPVRFERLVSTSAPRGYGSSIFPGHLIESYRHHFQKDRPLEGTGRRLYISRQDASSRKFSNETEIIAALEKEGFEEIQMSKYNFKEKSELFASAEFIVGLSGAGLTSLIFCPPQCKVLELFPDNELSYIYASIAEYLKLSYSPLIFKTESSLNQINRFYGEFTLDTDALLSAVRKLR